MKRFLKNMVFSTLFIYGIDLFTYKIGVIIPINFVSIGFSTFLGIPGLLTYVLLYFKFYY